MSRKITVLLMTLSVVMFANAQEYNLFDPADVDANGWIWFDTQEKIDKYIGQANNEDGKIDPNGKIIQLICADFGDYEDSTADPAVKGAGTDGEMESADAKNRCYCYCQFFFCNEYEWWRLCSTYAFMCIF